MSEVILLPAPEGPPLEELAAVLDDSRCPLLLDSGPEPNELARWHLLLFDPVETLQLDAEDGRRAFGLVEEALRRHWPDAMPTAVADGPPFRGGAAGLFGYDLGRQLERLGPRRPPDAPLADLLVGLYPFCLAEDVVGGGRLVVGRGTPVEAERFLASVRAAASRARPLSRPGRAPGSIGSTFGREAYEQAVGRVIEYIRAGDIYQVNLSQRFEVPFHGGAPVLHAALRCRFPAPFGALLRWPGLAVVSASPELFLRRRGSQVESRPIKGTRPRHLDPQRDAQLRAELESSSKERAELAMIVDMVRNDLGRTARVGSVRVRGPFRTEAWSTVFHRVAVVTAQVGEGVSVAELVEGAFPPASVTGAPKIRAMEIIGSLEPVRRHAYTGAIGWIGADGDLDLSVAIRIATLVGNRLLVPVGGGITLESDPAAEYEETLHKVRALFDVLGLELPGRGVCV